MIIPTTTTTITRRIRPPATPPTITPILLLSPSSLLLGPVEDDGIVLWAALEALGVTALEVTLGVIVLEGATLLDALLSTNVKKKDLTVH